MKNTARGNVLMYVMIAVMLFGALSFMLAKQEDGGGATGSLKESEADMRAEELINYATSVRTAVEQLTVLQNVLPAELDFVKPGEAGYDTAPHAAKVFHPVGGGVSAFTSSDAIFASGSAKRGWVVQQSTNAEWTQTTAGDVILTFLDVDTAVCKAINKRILRDKTIPDTTVNSSAVFIKGGADDTDFALSDCSSCNQRLGFCIRDASGANAFYNIVLSR